MRKYGLIGGSLSHSLSPRIHEIFFELTGVAGTYDLLETGTEELPEVLLKLSRTHRGINVTIPHKVNIMPLLDEISAEAAAVGAVNTICFTEGAGAGYNTDYFGFGKMLEYNGISVSGKTAVILGSGGAARAAAKYLTDGQSGGLYITMRDTGGRAQDFYDICPHSRIINYAGLRELQGDILINCTPVGMFPRTEGSPVDEEISRSFAVSVDLIYNPSKTLFLRQAEQAGKQAVNGMFMLVAQAVAAQEIWQGCSYGSDLVPAIMKRLGVL